MRFVVALLIAVILLGILYAYGTGVERFAEQRAQAGEVAVTLPQKILFSTAHYIYRDFVALSFLVFAGAIAIAAALEEHAKNCHRVRPEVGLGPRS